MKTGAKRGPEGGIVSLSETRNPFNAQRPVVVKAAPSSSFEMPEPHLLFEFLKRGYFDALIVIYRDVMRRKDNRLDAALKLRVPRPLPPGP